MNAIWSGSHLQTNGGTKGLSKTPLRGYSNNGVINVSSPACLRHRHKHEKYTARNQRIQDKCHHDKTKSNQELHKWRVSHPHGLRQSCSSCQIQQNNTPTTSGLDNTRSSGRHKNVDTVKSSVDARLIKRNRSPSAPHILRHTDITSNPWIEREKNKLEAENENHINKFDDDDRVSTQSRKYSLLGNLTRQPKENTDFSASNDIVEGEIKYIFKETSV